MDKLKNMAQGMMNKEGSSNQGAAPQAGGAPAGQEDYADKGLDAAEKKFGMSESRATNEKITDGARDFYEKETGKNVSNKFSN